MLAFLEIRERKKGKVVGAEERGGSPFLSAQLPLGYLCLSLCFQDFNNQFQHIIMAF